MHRGPSSKRNTCQGREVCSNYQLAFYHCPKLINGNDFLVLHAEGYALVCSHARQLLRFVLPLASKGLLKKLNLRKLLL